MPPIFRNLLAVAAGLVVGSIINMVIVTVGPILIPPPAGVDMSELDQFSANLKKLQPVHFIAPWMAHSLGTLSGAFTAAKIAASSKMLLAIGVGLFFLLGGIIMVGAFGGPLWFCVVDLIGAYLPMAFLGGKLGEGEKES